MTRSKDSCLTGQYTIYSFFQKKTRPADYSFQRYIGQKVYDSHGIHTIKEIEPFYTIYDDGMVGSPHDMSPVNKRELMESLVVEHEYFSELLRKDHSSFRSVYAKNIELIEKRLNELKEAAGRNED